MAKKPGPKKYVPREPIEAMKVEPPFKAVAEWCGGEIVKDGPRFAFISIAGRDGFRTHLRRGDYVVRVLPGGNDFVRWDAALFEKHNKEAQEQ
ncbi:hypothetical protein SEA_REYNAULD_65 [Rhodococcus phage Reynauld]|uniref:Uncharacterized protein n=1 Tax=Rhodococcus phage Reynauld TaxID=3062845 RepID=A0ACD4UJJ5_9CAUD|nr:hypothetical protein SEA_REYNAULD_65 [Rhodococcus phage Reynauld]